MDVVYFSSISENTHKFVEKLELPADEVHRIPLHRADESLEVDREFILITPTYGGGRATSTVPKQVINFLNNPDNRKHIRGVVAAGNTNFGQHYGLAGKLISLKCGVPLMHSFEIMGMPEDVNEVLSLLERR